MKVKILVLCTYPIDEPRHGGQIRVRKIVDNYRQSGFQVEVAGVLGSDSYLVSDGFEPSPPPEALAKILDNPFLMEDVAIAQLYAKDEKYFNSLAKKIKQVPDIIHIEQPWLFSFAQRYNKEHLRANAKLIYGAQNIEYQLKDAILKPYFSTEQVRLRKEQVKKLEMSAVTGADGVISVSKHDQEWLTKQVQVPVILAPNGVSQWQITAQSIDEANQITQHQKCAFFCASGHPPNVTGFFDLFSDGFGSLDKQQKLIIAGGAGHAIERDERVYQSVNLAASVTIAGIVSDTCLSGLLHIVHCIILPITQGGGTNLKTAEALWSGHHIIATSTAMRGFEGFIEQQGVHIADTPAMFKQQLRRVMQAPPLKLSQQDRASRASVLWEQCLKPLETFIRNLV